MVTKKRKKKKGKKKTKESSLLFTLGDFARKSSPFSSQTIRSPQIPALQPSPNPNESASERVGNERTGDMKEHWYGSYPHPSKP